MKTTPPCREGLRLKPGAFKRGPLLPATQAADPQGLSGNTRSQAPAYGPGLCPQIGRGFAGLDQGEASDTGPEWQELLKAIARDHEITADEAVASIREKIVSIQLPGTSVKLFCAVENLGSIAGAFRVSPEALGARDVLSNKSSAVGPLCWSIFFLRNPF